ncbi:DUF3817 domain-containing protein [Bacillus carboniphilus]|uniref:DUF3817 domain-containing protein n=1 Tax=Bacillus carboniphilus TaxID=86663 RepID=A0ABY9JR02_9BACI|nr:DUF3817 domain-containing protein [Bacillus carboniphilus]WLR41816.1 DUF3817 domain-containing protein [Bacillus carboniphilus]
MWKTTSGQFRLAGMIEGLSYLVLLFIAMPLKYFFDIPEAVSIVGMAHGVLFVIYMIMIFWVTIKIRWPFRWLAGAVIVALIPFGYFVYDAKLIKSNVMNDTVI